MILTSEAKKKIFKKFGKSEKNTGSPEGQVAVFTHRITHLTDHLKTNRKDFVSQRSLQILVGKRKSLLNYLKNKDIERYRAVIKELDLRK